MKYKSELSEYAADFINDTASRTYSEVIARLYVQNNGAVSVLECTKAASFALKSTPFIATELNIMKIEPGAGSNV